MYKNLYVLGTYPGKPWIAGKVNGSTLAILKSKGQQSFTVTRNSGYAAGVYDITFPAHPDGADYVVQLCSQINNIWVWIGANALPVSSTGFSVVTTNSANAVADGTFYLTVLG